MFFHICAVLCFRKMSTIEELQLDNNKEGGGRAQCLLCGRVGMEGRDHKLEGVLSYTILAKLSLLITV